MSLFNRPIPNIPGLPPSPQDTRDWREWADRVLEHRVETAYRGQISEEVRAQEAIRCSKSFLYCAATYGFIFEARDEQSWDDENEWDDEDYDDQDVDDWNDEKVVEGGVIPFIPYPFQIETAAWIDRRMKGHGINGDGVAVKARDMGLSNLFAFWTAHKWLFRNPFQARLLSRKEALVDRTGDPDSLFWKIDTFLMSLPDYVFEYGAPNFDWRRDRLQFRLINPSNGNLISGESTQADAGRGGRATVIIYDEAAFMEDFGEIWSAGRDSTHHRFAISTVSTRKGFDFYNLVHGEEGYTEPPTLKIEWNEHPLHDLEWFNAEQKRDNPKKFAREVLMDWHAGAGEWVYPETHTMAPVNLDWIPHAGDLVVMLDDGGDDNFAFIFAQYNEHLGRLEVLRSYQNNHQPADFYGELLTGRPSGKFRWTKEDRELIEWLKTKPAPVYYGDAHGVHTEQILQESLYGYLWDKYGIIVNYYVGKESGTRLTFRQRRLAAGKVLSFTDFGDHPTAAYVLTAFKRHKFREDEEHQQIANEAREPLHSNKWSHLVSAFEYFAVQFEMFLMTTAKGKGSAKFSAPRKKRT